MGIEAIAKRLCRYNNQIVPIIGEEMFSYEGKMLREYVVGKMLSTDDDINKYCNDSYYGLQRLCEKVGERNYVDVMNELNPVMDENLKNFLTTFQFDVIITTSPFPFIEKVLNEALGSDFKYEQIWYSIDNNTGNQNDIFSKKEGDQECTKKIIHIFGDDVRGVFDEKGLLNYLHGISVESMAQGSIPWHLNQYMKNKQIMVIGCDLPNWIFRFLWRSVKNFDNSRDEYWMNDNEKKEEKTSFNDFLNQVKFTRCGLSDEAKRIMQRACELKIQDEENRQKQSENQLQQFEYDIFISHSGDEHGTEVARKIRDILSEMDLGVRKIKVWIDKTEKQNNVDGQYQRKWEDAIVNSRFFMPVVSGKYLERMFDSVNNPNVSLKQETDYAIKHYRDRKYEEKKITYFLPVIETGQEFAMGKSYKVNEDFLEFFSSPSNPFHFLPSEVFFGMDMRIYDCNPKDSNDKDVRNKNLWRDLFEKYGLL